MQKTITLIVGFLLTFSASCFSQEASFLQFLPGVSQSSVYNPAIQNKSDKIIIGIPFLSGVQAGWNSNVASNALFSKGFEYSFTKLYEKLPAEGKARFAGNISMFYASFKLQKWNLSLSLNEKLFGTTSFDRDVTKIIRDGTLTYFGKDENFGSGSFNFEHYRELALGFSYRLWKELDFGIRPKLLFGRTYFNAQDISASVQTDFENRELLFSPEGSFILSAPLTVNHDSITNFTNFRANVYPGNYFFNLRNMGFALDFGFVYRPNKLFEIAASLSDLGFVGYRNNLFNVDFTDPIRYPQEALYQSVVMGDRYMEPREALKSIGDSISYIVDARISDKRILTPTPFKINLATKFHQSKSVDVGLVNVFSYYGKYSVNQFSGYWHKTLSDKFEYAGSITVYNLSSVLFGLGASYTANYFQIHVSSNNILGIVRPLGTKNLNLSFGINLLFATKTR